jgi:hypothetical protein
VVAISPRIANALNRSCFRNNASGTRTAAAIGIVTAVIAKISTASACSINSGATHGERPANAKPMVKLVAICA